MGCCVSKDDSTTRASASGSVYHTADLSSYRAACRVDDDLHSFDKRVHASTSQAISNIATGVEVRSLSFESMVGITECLMEMNQEVISVILECKDDILGSKELSKLVEEYFENSSHTLDFCNALEKCLKLAKDSQLLVLAALNQFDQESEMACEKREMCSKTLEDLKKFRAAGDPFTDDLFIKFKSVYHQQMKMLKTLLKRKKKLDKKLKSVHAWRMVFQVIFLSAFAAVLLGSIVAAAIAAPPVAAIVSAASSIPIGSIGKWVDSLWKKYENALKGRKSIINSMQVVSFVAIKDLDIIRALIHRLELEITSMLKNAELALDKGELRFKIADIRMQLGTFVKNIEDLGARADTCSSEIRRARIVVLQRIIQIPTNDD